MEELAPLVVAAIAEFIDGDEDINSIETEIVIYALAQIISNKINTIDLDDKDKGAVVSTIVGGLCEFHGDYLAFHREYLATLIEQKTSTIH